MRQKTERADRGNFVSATANVETLMLDALEQADAWQARVSAEGYRGELSNKVPGSRKRHESRGMVVTEDEKRSYKPSQLGAHDTDPPVRMIATTYRGRHGLAHAQCLRCGEMHRRRPGSDRPCSFCKGRFFAWSERETDTYIGEDYSLPATYYGDHAGVGSHYRAVEALVNAPRNHGNHKGGRSGLVYRIVPIGPDGAMRYLVTTKIIISAKRGPKLKVTGLRPVNRAESETLFHDGASPLVVNQRIEE